MTSKKNVNIDDTEKMVQFAVGAIGSLRQKHSRKTLWRHFSNDIYKMCALDLGIELFDKQEEIIFAQHKTKVVRAARRTAKSFNSAFIAYGLLKFSSIFGYPLHIKFAGPRAEDTRHIWEHLHNFLDQHPIVGLDVTYDNWGNKSTHKKELTFSNGTWIKSASCDSPEMNDIRGDAHDFLVVDEYGQIKYKNAFLEAATYSLKDKQPLNMLMIVGTFDVIGMGADFDRLFNLGQEGRDTIMSWTLKGSDNPHSDIESAQLAKDIVTEEGFLREEMGEGVPQHGRMFGDFNLKKQIIDLSYDPEEEILVGIDFGYRKPIVLFGQYIDEKIYVLHEISPKDISIEPLISEIQAVLIGKFNNATPLMIGCDPAGDKVNDVVSYNSFELLKKSFYMATYTRNPQLVSKANQVILLKALTIQDRIFVDKSCEKLIRSFAMATPDVSRAGIVNSPGWKKEGGADDPLDALAYMLVNYGYTSKLIIPEPENNTAPSERAIQIAMSRF